MRGVDNDTLKKDVEVLNHLNRSNISDEEAHSLNHAIELMQQDIEDYEENHPIFLDTPLVLKFPEGEKTAVHDMQTFLDRKEAHKAVYQDMAYNFNFRVEDEIKANIFVYNILWPLVNPADNRHKHLVEMTGINGTFLGHGEVVSYETKNDVINTLESVIRVLKQEQ